MRKTERGAKNASYYTIARRFVISTARG